jgi:hypothetical protein
VQEKLASHVPSDEGGRDEHYDSRQYRVEVLTFVIKSCRHCIQVSDMMRIKPDACWLGAGFAQTCFRSCVDGLCPLHGDTFEFISDKASFTDLDIENILPVSFPDIVFARFLV